MRKLLFILLVSTIFSAEAQLLNRVKDKVKQTAEDRAVQEAGDATNKTIDNALSGPDENTDEPDTDNNESQSEEVSEAPREQKTAPKQSTIKAYASYDFVPGDRIIFQYDMAGEADAEIPGRMLVNDGTVEVQTHEGEKVLFIPPAANLSMKPLMKNDGYLPEQFTLEFDVLANGNDGDGSSIDLYFRSAEDGNLAWTGQSLYYIRLSSVSGNAGGIDFTMHKPDGNTAGGYKPFPKTALLNDAVDTWRRVAIYVNKTIGKVYVDQHRVGIANQISPGAGMVTFEFANDTHPILIKNIRIAAGGSDAYNKVVTDGKFIAYGILFDVNRATLKPESMGTINEISKMMKEHTDLKFEIGGHTDSDGSATLNNKLSQERADAVKQQLVSMGIDGSRLTTKGYGATKPVADNNTPENKARNRRVEFVKK